MRISDWSSDVCSSNLTAPIKVGGLGWPVSGTLVAGYGAPMPDGSKSAGVLIGAPAGTTVTAVADGTVVLDRKSVVEGKSVSVRVDLGGRRIIKTKTLTHNID